MEYVGGMRMTLPSMAIGAHEALVVGEELCRAHAPDRRVRPHSLAPSHA
jgi:hypothetical protein